MTKPLEAADRPADARNRIIVALDVEKPNEALAILDELHGQVGAFKIGLQLFTAAGPALVRELAASGVKVFLDLKFHDIPNTVAKAGVEAAKLGVWMFNVHAAGGGEMMKRTADDVREFCAQNGLARPLIIGVTVLTSANAGTLDEIGVRDDVETRVVRLARLAHTSGLDGVVASPQEVVAIRRALEDDRFVTVTPGIRAIAATSDDQKRVTTLREAIANGSDYVVIGRPITRAKDRIAALQAMIAETED